MARAAFSSLCMRQQNGFHKLDLQRVSSVVVAQEILPDADIPAALSPHDAGDGEPHGYNSGMRALISWDRASYPYAGTR